MTPDEWKGLGTFLGIVFGSGGAAWAGVKYSVNGMREDVAEIKADVKKLFGKQATDSERIAVLETKVDK